jgi:hypothetical protein
MGDIVSQYFNNSYPSMLAFFAKQQNLSEGELNEIIEIIKSKIMTPIFNCFADPCRLLAFYKTLLVKETFFRINRLVLLGCLLLSLAYPLSLYRTIINSK